MLSGTVESGFVTGHWAVAGGALVVGERGPGILDNRRRCVLRG